MLHREAALYEVFSNGYKILQFLKRPIPSNAKN